MVARRRMVRSYDTSRPVPPEVIDRIVHNALRAPSAGMSQGWGFLVLDNLADVARFRDSVRPPADPEEWFAANVDAPLLIVPLSNKDAWTNPSLPPEIYGGWAATSAALLPGASPRAG